jgi:hypothetical protein
VFKVGEVNQRGGGMKALTDPAAIDDSEEKGTVDCYS